METVKIKISKTEKVSKVRHVKKHVLEKVLNFF